MKVEIKLIFVGNFFDDVMEILSLLDWKMVVVCMFWNIIFLLGGGFVLVKVCMVWNI